MTKLKEMEKTLTAILRECPQTRGDDDLLYVKFLAKKKISLSKFSAKDFILEYRKNGLPTIESVGRCRRKIQERYPHLKPTEKKMLKRKAVADSFYSYALYK